MYYNKEMLKSQEVLSFYKKADPKIYSYMEEADFGEFFEEWSTKKSTHDYFLALCQNIVGQQLSIKAADTIFARFEQLFPNKNVTPKNILARGDQELRNAGLSWGKVKYVKSLAEEVATKRLLLEKLVEFDDQEIIVSLTKVKGIGRWTAEMFLIFTLKRQNVFSHGDLGLKRAIEKIYGIQNPTYEQILQIVDKWDPYKTFGSVALWSSLK